MLEWCWKKEEHMWDVLIFEKFITQNILIFFYYVGVLFIPIMLWIFKAYFVDKVTFLQNSQKNLQKVLLFFILFLCMQLCLRIVFEFMIGYFDMHDYLYAISQK